MRFILLLPVLVMFFGCGNNPPSVPIVMGAVCGRPGDSLWFNARSVDHESDSIAYLFDWGDEKETGWSCWYPSGDECRAVHVFQDSGLLMIKAKAKDAGHETGWSEEFPVRVRDFGPCVPSRPSGSGPDTVPIGDKVSFVTGASHPLGEYVAIQFDWGDTVGTWSGFVAPKSIVRGCHVYYGGGVFAVKARAKDRLEHLSGWSKPESIWVIDTFWNMGNR